MNIGIIGSGNIGSTLPRHLTALGHQVLMPTRARQAITETISVVPGLPNNPSAIFMWATPRRLHQAMFARVMNG